MSHSSKSREEPYTSPSIISTGFYSYQALHLIIHISVDLTLIILTHRSIKTVRLNTSDAQLVFSGALHTEVINTKHGGHVFPSECPMIYAVVFEIKNRFQLHFIDGILYQMLMCA